MMKPDSCAEREKLAQSVAAAVHQTYMARHDLRAAQTDRSGDTARFIIALERARSKQRDAQNAHQKHVEEHRCGLNGISLAHSGSCATILILDAEEVIRSVITRILEREGYTVHATGDLPSAMELVKNCTPDLLLTNLYIPGTSGHDAAQLPRSLCPKMRVLIVAGLPDDRLIHDRTKGEGFAAFPKPFNPKQLTEKVRNVLEGKLE